MPRKPSVCVCDGQPVRRPPTPALFDVWKSEDCVFGSLITIIWRPSWKAVLQGRTGDIAGSSQTENGSHGRVASQCDDNENEGLGGIHGSIQISGERGSRSAWSRGSETVTRALIERSGAARW